MQSNPEQNPLAWLKKADEDELSARAVLKEGAPSTACFLAQQMAEKLLKGLLVLHDKDFPKVHDLLELETLLLDLESEVQEFHHDLALLNRYYIETRYPGDYPEFSQGECQQAYEAALRIKEFVLGKVKSRETSGLGSLGIIILFAAVVALFGGGYWIYNTYFSGTGVACTQEAKLCPDGSYVSRTGPNCEFAECPAPTPPQKSEMDISTWKTYRNEKYGFEVRYPSNFELFESEREIKIYRADPAEKIDVSMSISVEEKDAETALRDFVSLLSTGRGVSFFQEFFVSSSVKIGGRWGTKIEARVVGIPPTIFIPKDSGHSFLISFSRWYLGDTEEIASSSAVVYQILSTFKFIR